MKMPSWSVIQKCAIISLVSLYFLYPYVKKRVTKAKNKAIADYVGKTVKMLFQKPGGVMEIGEFQKDGGTIRYFKNAPKTLGHWFNLSKKHAELEAVVFTGKPGESPVRWTFGELMARAEAVQSFLKSKYQIKKGDRVSILMSNIPELCVVFMAVTKMGAIAVMLNAFWEGEEIEFGLKDSSSALLISDEKRISRLIPSGRLEMLMREGLKLCVVRPSAELKKFGIADFDELCNERYKTTPTWQVDETVTPDDICYIMYTSGTTGKFPKGVVQTHFSTIQTAMSFQLFAELMKTLRGEPKKRRVDLINSPLFHAAALCAGFLLSFHDGNKIVLIPRWDVDHALKVCLDEQVTFFGAMPTMLSDMLASKFFIENKEKFTFTNIGTGGAATPSKLILQTAKILPTVTQGSGWGMTESNAIGTIIGGADYIEIPSSCGKAHPIVEIKLVDPETGEEIKQGELGELCIRSCTNMQGYWNNPEETSKVLLPRNWLKSGDLGRVDSEGFVYIVDRVKDIVIRGGENISTREVEECVYSFSNDVLEASAFGLPHERLGEQLALAVVSIQGKDIDKEKLKQYCESKLAKFKVPSLIFVRSIPLPRGGTGKVMKRKLKEEYLSQVAVLS